MKMLTNNRGQGLDNNLLMNHASRYVDLARYEYYFNVILKNGHDLKTVK